MNRIDGAQLQPAPQVDQFQGAKRSEKAESEKTGSAPAAPEQQSARPTDTAEISDRARQLMDMKQAYDAGMEAVGREPEVRQEKLAAVRQRLEEGYYNSVEVRQKVADGVLGTMDGMEKL